MTDYYPQPEGSGVRGVDIIAAADEGYVAIVYPDSLGHPWVCRVAESNHWMAETVVLLYQDWKFIMERPAKEVQHRNEEGKDPSPEETEVGVREEGSEESRD